MTILAILGLGIVLWGLADLVSASIYFLRAIWILLFELIPSLICWVLNID